MDFTSTELMYEFHAKDFSQPESFKAYADQAVKEIKSKYGWDTEVHINIETVSKDKGVFSVSMTVFGLGETITAKKDGKHALSIFRKVRKTVMRQIHKLSKKRINFRKKQIFKERFAS